jgi:O-antigen/teichoic acid export membrane protein
MFISDDLLKAGSIMFFSTIISGAVDWFYHIFMGRTLGPDTYGEFGALFALSFFLSYTLLTTIRISNTRFISIFKGQNNYQIMPSFHSKMYSRMIVFGLVAFVIFSLLSGYIAEFLHIESIYLILLIGVVFLLSWLLPVNLGMMQGLQKFNHLALNNLLRAVFKFAFGAVLVLMGYGIYGAVGGLVIGILVALIISFYSIRDSIKIRSSNDPSSEKSNPDIIEGKSHDETFKSKEISKFSVYVLITVACLTIPTNVDIILVKHFFSERDTSLYTAASVFGKMLFFIAVSISTVMYPKVIEAHAKNRDTKSILNRSLFYTGVPSALMVIALWIFPGFFLKITYGEDYLEAESLLGLYGLMMFFFSLNSIFIYYYLAKNRYGLIYLFAIFSTIELGLVWFYHSSMSQIIQMFLVINIIILGLSFLLGFYHRGPEKKSIK